MGSRSRKTSFPERTGWLIVVLVLAAALVALLMQRRGPDPAAHPSLGREGAPVQPGPAGPAAPVAEATPAPQGPAPLSDDHLRRLRATGLQHPTVDLIRDLRRRPGLVPHEAVLGGRMYFVESESFVLSDRWVLATFEDGHIRGRMLLEYRIPDQGEIAWRVLDSYLE